MGYAETTSGLFLTFLAAAPWGLLAMVEAVCRPEYKNLPGNITHTACKKPDPNCEIIVGELTADEKSQTLKAHNDYRSEVAQGKIKGFPKATNMYHLIWDDELADVAQAFTNQCDDSKHDLQGERFTTKFANVGQNFAYNSDSTDMRGPDATGHIFNWFEEYKDFPPDAIDPFNPPSGSAVVTHFTQVVWAETRYLGCGYTHYKHRTKTPQYPFYKLFACNYAPSGNILQQPMYKSGDTCSACPSGTTCDTGTGLCGAPGEADEITTPTDRSKTLVWAIAVVALVSSLGLAVVAGVLYANSREQPTSEGDH